MFKGAGKMNAMTGMGGGAAMGPAIKATGPTQTDLNTTMRYDEKQRAPFEEDEDPDNEVVQVQEWIPEVHLTPLTTLTFICRRASGKTNAIRDICERYFRHHIKHFVLFSPTADADSGAYPFIDRRFVFPRPSSLILRRIEARQKRLLQKNMLKEKGPSGITRASKRVCMIFDDHFDMMDQQTQSELARMMSIGRHLNITIIQAVQYSKGTLTPAMRLNSDWIFLSSNLSHDTKLMLAKEHLPGGEISKQVLSTVPVGYRMLVIGNCVKTSEGGGIGEVVFHYQANGPDEIKPFNITGLLDDSSSDEEDEHVQLSRTNDGEHVGPKYGKAEKARAKDMRTKLDQGGEWWKRMPEMHQNAQVTRVEGKAGEEFDDAW
jgi:hypothetical protein